MDAEAPVSNRDRLIEAARELYWRQGVAVTSPRQVMAASGVGHGSLYHHFPGKLDLAEAAIRASIADGLASVRRELRGGSPARERLRRYLERPRDAVAGCRVGRLTYEEYVLEHDALSAPVREYFTTLLTLVEDVLAELPGANGGRSRERAYAAVAILQGGYVLSRALGDPAALRHAVTGFLDLLTDVEGVGEQ